MSRRLSPLLVLCGWLLLAPAPAGTLPLAVDGQPLPSLAPMLERVLPAVVHIATRGRPAAGAARRDPLFERFFGAPPGDEVEEGLGSGVIIDARRGHVVTNAHVVEGAESIRVTLRDGRHFSARLLGSDPAADIAVLRIAPDHLTALPLADSSRLRVGDFVVAIGNPFGLEQTVTSGIVSALGRRGLGIESYEDFIQTDASINPGNSGGALVNLRGELVGINTAILGPNGASIGIGFAIPVNMARAIAEQLVQYGEVRRGRLGIGIQDLTPELAGAFHIRPTRGAVVAQVVPGSAAERAGLRVGDVIVRVNGRPVRDASQLRNEVGLLRVGSRVELEVMRDGKSLRLSTEVAPPPRAEPRGQQLS